MAKGTKSLSLSDLDDDQYYEIQLLRATRYPPGPTGRLLPVGARITMRGKAAKLIVGDIANAVPKP